MNINFPGMMDNALSRANEVQLRTLTTRVQNPSNTQTQHTPRAPRRVVVEGHYVNQSDEQRTDKKLLKSCEDFESIFISQLMKEMRKTLNNKNNILHGGQAEEIFNDMLYDKYSQLASRQSDFGIARVMYDHLSTINRGYPGQ